MTWTKADLALLAPVLLAAAVALVALLTQSPAVYGCGSGCLP